MYSLERFTRSSLEDEKMAIAHFIKFAGNDSLFGGMIPSIALSATELSPNPRNTSGKSSMCLVLVFKSSFDTNKAITS